MGNIKNAYDGYLDEVFLRYDSPADSRIRCRGGVPLKRDARAQLDLYTAPTSTINHLTQAALNASSAGTIPWLVRADDRASRYRDFFYAGRRSRTAIRCRGLPTVTCRRSRSQVNAGLFPASGLPTISRQRQERDQATGGFYTISWPIWQPT